MRRVGCLGEESWVLGSLSLGEETDPQLFKLTIGSTVKCWRFEGKDIILPCQEKDDTLNWAN